jgi:FkbM family methyltransferase
MSALPNAASFFARLPRFFRRHKLIVGWMRWTKENTIQLVPVYGNTKGYADLSEGMLRLILIDSGFEADFFNLAQKLLPFNGVFFDVGANFGLMSVGLAGEVAPQAMLHIFEPNPRLSPWIEKSLRKLGHHQFHINQCAVSDFTGTIRMSINPEHTGESHISIDGNETVNCIRLDDYVRSHQISRIDLMKLDVEGFELTALKGMSESLQRGVVKCLYFEFMKKWLARHGDPLELLNFLDHCGFEIFYCRPHDLEKFATESAKHEVMIGNQKLRLAKVDVSQTPEHTDLLAIHSSLLGPTT